MCGICVESWPLSAVFLGVLAQAVADVFDLCGVFHHGVLGGAQHILAVVGHGLAQGARLGLGSNGDLSRALLGGLDDLGIADQNAGALLGFFYNGLCLCCACRSSPGSAARTSSR